MLGTYLSVIRHAYDQLVTKTYPRLRRFNRWLLYFNEWSGTVLNKKRKDDKVSISKVSIWVHNYGLYELVDRTYEDIEYRKSAHHKSKSIYNEPLM